MGPAQRLSFPRAISPLPPAGGRAWGRREAMNIATVRGRTRRGASRKTPLGTARRQEAGPSGRRRLWFVWVGFLPAWLVAS